MIRLTKSAHAWGKSDFSDILKNEIEQLSVSQLPLQQGMSASSYALDNNLTVMILSVSEQEDHIRAMAGVFYSGVIAGCSCADDPTPVNEQTEYCEIQIDINKKTAEAALALL
jgi:hypothetical protein